MAMRVIAFILLSWAGVAGALAIAVDGASLNESDPNTGLPWANVGIVNGASGIYLGNGWVLAAQHVTGSTAAAGTLSITLNGTAYYSVDSVVTLTNPDGSASDLTMFNIGTSPAGLSSVSLLTSTVADHSSLTLVGYGEHVSGARASVPISGGTASGYNLDGQIGLTKSWGTTTVAATNLGIQSAPGHNAFQEMRTSAFQATGSSGTAQAEVGDSGGAAFVKIGSTWYLAATINAIGSSGVDGNGDASTNYAVQGDLTYLADISVYSTQINNLIATTAAPEPGVVSLLGAGGLGAAWRLLRRRR